MCWQLILLYCCAALQSYAPSEPSSSTDSPSSEECEKQEEIPQPESMLLDTHVTLGATAAVSFDQAIQALCSIVGIGLTIDTEHRPARKFVLRNGTLRNVLNSLCGSDLKWEVQDGHLHISAACYNHNHRVPFPPTHTKIWTEIRDTLIQILGAESRFTINAETGILLASGSESQHNQIANYLQSLKHQQTAQTCISVTVIKVESSRSLDAGARLVNVCDALGPDALSMQSGGVEVVATKPTKHVLRAICKALEAQGKVRTTSNALVSAANNRKAVLQIDTNIVYFMPETVATPTNTGSGKHAKVELRTHKMSTANTGTLLRIQPTMTGDGAILDLHFCVSAHVGDAHNPDQHGYVKVPLINKQLIDTTINLQAGRGILLGGLLARSTKRHRAGLPLLSRLPVLGMLFGTTTRLKKYERIYIYIQLLPTGMTKTARTAKPNIKQILSTCATKHNTKKSARKKLL